MEMLAELKAVHVELLAALAELDRLTADESFDEAKLANARVRLSRASGNRRRLCDELINALVQSAPEADAQRLQALRERNATQLEASTAHIGLWGMRDIRSDWPGYRDASRAMRQWMRDLVSADREVLYPMLERPRE